MVRLSELMRNRSDCTKHKQKQNKQKKKQLWLILLINCYTKSEHFDFLTSSTGQARIILIAHLYILFF